MGSSIRMFFQTILVNRFLQVSRNCWCKAEVLQNIQVVSFILCCLLCSSDNGFRHLISLPLGLGGSGLRSQVAFGSNAHLPCKQNAVFIFSPIGRPEAERANYKSWPKASERAILRLQTLLITQLFNESSGRRARPAMGANEVVNRCDSKRLDFTKKVLFGLFCVSPINKGCSQAWAKKLARKTGLLKARGASCRSNASCSLRQR